MYTTSMNIIGIGADLLWLTVIYFLCPEYKQILFAIEQACKNEFEFKEEVAQKWNIRNHFLLYG